MNKKLILGILAATVAGTFVLAPKAVEAYRGDPAVHGPNYTEERHEAMEKAFADADYAAWKNLMAGRGRVTQVINKDNFAKFVKAHQLAEQGKIDEANKIRAELGLGLRNGSGMGQGMGYGRMGR